MTRMIVTAVASAACGALVFLVGFRCGVRHVLGQLEGPIRRIERATGMAPPAENRGGR